MQSKLDRNIHIFTCRTSYPCFSHNALNTLFESCKMQLSVYFQVELRKFYCYIFRCCRKVSLIQSLKMTTQTNSQNCKALLYFKLADETKFIYACTIESCGKQAKGKNIGNLVSHLKHVHTNIYKEKINPLANHSKSIELKRLEMLQACTEIITANGRPFKYLTDSGYQLVIHDTLRQLEENGQEFVVNRNNFGEVRSYIKQCGKKILDKIRDEAKNQLVSVMTDIGSKNDRSILGTNIRYVNNYKIVTRNVGMTLITERHTSRVLKDNILDQL